MTNQRIQSESGVTSLKGDADVEARGLLFLIKTLQKASYAVISHQREPNVR